MNNKPILNTYYWILNTNNIVPEYLPILHNIDKKWVLDTLTSRHFISSYQLERLYGKNCVKKVVDFKHDVDILDSTDTEMGWLIHSKDVLFGNHLAVYLNEYKRFIAVSEIGNITHKLVYKGE